MHELFSANSSVLDANTNINFWAFVVAVVVASALYCCFVSAFDLLYSRVCFCQ